MNTKHTLSGTCEAPPRRAARGQLDHARGEHEPEEEPAHEPEGYSVVFSDHPGPSDSRQRRDEDAEEARLQEQVVPARQAPVVHRGQTLQAAADQP